MAVKWIGDVASELGIDVLEAVEFLAGKQNYPMNGLLDEERVQFLKLGKGANRMESTNPVGIQTMPAGPPPPPQEEGRGKKGKGDRSGDKGETAAGPPVVTGRDKAEDRTVIIQNPMQQAQQGNQG